MADEDQITYNDVQVECFGLMDPCDWAATLSTKLLEAAQSLRTARDYQQDPAKDVTASTDTEALSAIRAGVVQFLSEAHVMLHSMPMMQKQPMILEAMRFIVAGIADIERGVRAEWLAPISTKKHLKRLEKEAEWVPIIAALELLILHPGFGNDDRAAHEILSRMHRTSSISSIKRWHSTLFRNGRHTRPTAWAAIDEELRRMRAILAIIERERWSEVINRRVSELLHS